MIFSYIEWVKIFKFHYWFVIACS